MLRLVFHEDRRDRNILLELCLWVKLWVADSYWPLQIEENISPKCWLDPCCIIILRSGCCPKLGWFYKPPAWMAVSEAVSGAAWRESSGVGREARGLALGPLPGSATCWLWDWGQITPPLSLSVPTYLAKICYTHRGLMQSNEGKYRKRLAVPSA